ncbi:hypothetical protein [Amycolatopsis taiwanensis]|uniref:Uncharacterized protein n=1 Tax=Amycolatopsis taiwanensis TaxID=342230 RepID=A0A9W6VLP5_9PSEU|nr:hypothetical protein [Amycolatopsis taiwanensis]GLY70731.1 hypothetical protein Atai01_73500 [Amycolatopsis taiwanensis]
MTEPIDLPGMAEAARLLDDQTQQLMPVPGWLDGGSENELPSNPSVRDE